jgi:hypothetical protein
VLNPWAKDPFQRWMDLSEQAAEPVGDPGGLARQVVVEARDHRELGDRRRPRLLFHDLAGEAQQLKPGRENRSGVRR